jgi:hypothetical protein
MLEVSIYRDTTYAIYFSGGKTPGARACLKFNNITENYRNTTAKDYTPVGAIRFSGGAKVNPASE